MNLSRDQLWKSLLDAGVVEGSAPAPGRLESPWYVRTLLAFSAWLASLFLLGFIAAGFSSIFDNSTTTLIIGGILIGAAYAVLRLPKNEFFAHVALATSLAGQAFVMWAIFDSAGSDGMPEMLLISLLQVALAIVMPNFVHRVFSAFIAAIALYVAAYEFAAAHLVSWLVMFVAAWLWLHEFHYPAQMKKLQAIAYGLVLALIFLKGGVLWGVQQLAWYASQNQTEPWLQPWLQTWMGPWLGKILATAVLLYVAVALLRRLGFAMTDYRSIAVLVCCVALGLSALSAKGVTLEVMISMLGFAGGNRLLLGLGMVSLLFFISSYYYMLNTTLLAKSATLFVAGLVLLSARFVLLRFKPADTLS